MHTQHRQCHRRQDGGELLLTGPSSAVTVSFLPHSTSSGPSTLSNTASGRMPGGPVMTETKASSAPSAPAPQ